MRKIYIALLLAMVWVTGCASSTTVGTGMPVAVTPTQEKVAVQENAIKQIAWFGDSDYLYYYHDEERKVGVWIYASGNRAGVGVLSDKEYK